MDFLSVATRFRLSQIDLLVTGFNYTEVIMRDIRLSKKANSAIMLRSLLDTDHRICDAVLG